MVVFGFVVGRHLCNSISFNLVGADLRHTYIQRQGIILYCRSINHYEQMFHCYTAIAIATAAAIKRFSSSETRHEVYR